MKLLIAVLLVLLISLQYRIWFGDGSLSEVVQLSSELEVQKQKLRELENRNKILEAQVLDLQNGLDAFEEKARNDLGMIKKGETFIQLIPADEPAEKLPLAIQSGQLFQHRVPVPGWAVTVPSNT